MKKILNFEIEKAEILEDEISSQFATARITAFSDGVSRHDTICDEESLRRTAHTIFETPIVYEYDGSLNDFGGHSKIPVIAGFIVPNSAEFYRRDDGRTSLSVKAKIWKKYATQFIDIFKSDNSNKRAVSVEIEIYDSQKESNGLLRLKDWIYTAVCVLGEFVTPASPNAGLEMLSFSKEENEEYKKVYVQEFGEHTNAYKLNKEIEKAITYLDRALTYAYEIKEDIGKESSKIYKSLESKKDDSKEENSHVVDNYLGVENIEKEDNTTMKSKQEMEEERKDIEPIEEEKEEKEDMAEAKEGEPVKEKEKMADEPNDDESEENKEEVEEDSDDTETMSDEERKNLMSLEKSIDVSSLLEFVNSESKVYRDKKEKSTDKIFSLLDSFAQEIAKGKKATVKAITNLMLNYMKQASSKIDELSFSNQNFILEVKELREFKANSIKEKFLFEVESSLSEALEAGVPVEKVDSLREESKNYSLEDIDSYKNMVRARAFVFSVNKEDDGEIKKIGLPFDTIEKKTRTEIWN